jgi:hypothetical protein
VSISPPSDIILDVARAADPAKLRAAAAKLTGSDSTGADFAAALAEQADPSPPAKPAATALPAVTAAPAAVRGAPVPLANSVAAGTAPAALGAAAGSPSSLAAATPPAITPADHDFEAMVLSQLFQSLMPQDDTMFGTGTAGNVWGGIFVQELGKAVAARGGIGIAAALARDANLHGATPATMAATGPSSAALLASGLAAAPGAISSLDSDPWSG